MMAVILTASSSPVYSCGCGDASESSGRKYAGFISGSSLGYCGLAPPPGVSGEDANYFINNGRLTGCEKYCNGDADCISCCSCCCSESGDTYVGSTNSCDVVPKDAPTVPATVPKEVTNPPITIEDPLVTEPLPTAGDCKLILYKHFSEYIEFSLSSFIETTIIITFKTRISSI